MLCRQSLQWRLVLGILCFGSIDGARQVDDGDLDRLGDFVANSWIAQLAPDPEQELNVPNTQAREVNSGHFVNVRPKPLPGPYLVAYSSEMAAELGLSEKVCRGDRFARLFSGDVDEVRGFNDSWATPYALSIYGAEQYPNGAGPSGNGYGDGRAISMAEVVMPGDGKRWELQLKGSGPTPFCRGSDGRAVLRSSVREFLVSEAMHHLGIPTTRALSLVASAEEWVARPWYSNRQGPGEPPAPKHGGDVMQREGCAITTRVSPSFLRVGHFELFGRRAQKGDKVGLRELELLARHALFREYPDHSDDSKPLQQQLLGMLTEAAKRFVKMAAHWLRVGYTQSNFNADNCLISGRTVDYGPFGFIEEYDPKWGMWIGSGEHFSFMNQPRAAHMNFVMFARSLVPLMDEEGVREVQRIVQGYEKLSEDAVDDMFAQKMGFESAGTKTRKLWAKLDSLMQSHPTDWNMLWRQLAEVPARMTDADNDNAPLEPLEAAFYEPLSHAKRTQWASWIRSWFAALADRDLAVVAARMRGVSPKYIPRESMLVEAYTAAQQGDASVVHELQELFRRPYDEQPAVAHRFYRRRAAGAENLGGVGFMS